MAKNKQMGSTAKQKASTSKRDKPLPNPWLPDRKMRYGIVYFIGGGTEGPIKIGFTSNSDPSRRLGELQVGSPEKLEILGQIDGTIEIEHKIHSFLHLHKVRGEWFHREAALSMLYHLSPCKGMRLPNLFADQFRDVAFTMEEINGDDESEEESLSATVARHLMLDLASRFRSCETQHPLPLRTWLIRQTDRENAIADLANDCKNDPSFPEVGSLTDYLTWIMEITCDSSITRTVVDAWIECQQAILKLNKTCTYPDP